jgi:hypothetical protein
VLLPLCNVEEGKGGVRGRFAREQVGPRCIKSRCVLGQAQVIKPTQMTLAISLKQSTVCDGAPSYHPHKFAGRAHLEARAHGRLARAEHVQAARADDRRLEHRERGVDAGGGEDGHVVDDLVRGDEAGRSEHAGEGDVVAYLEGHHEHGVWVVAGCVHLDDGRGVSSAVQGALVDGVGAKGVNRWRSDAWDAHGEARGGVDGRVVGVDAEAGVEGAASLHHPVATGGVVDAHLGTGAAIYRDGQLAGGVVDGVDVACGEEGGVRPSDKGGNHGQDDCLSRCICCWPSLRTTRERGGRGRGCVENIRARQGISKHRSQYI